ncbi:hypothetical protein FSST1_001703 [Fusarium sambucinum]
MRSVTLTTEYGRDSQDAALASFMSLVNSFTACNSLYVSYVTQFGINPDILAELSSWTRQRRKDVNIATARLLYIYKIFETSEGYLGAATTSQSS